MKSHVGVRPHRFRLAPLHGAVDVKAAVPQAVVDRHGVGLPLQIDQRQMKDLGFFEDLADPCLRRHFAVFSSHIFTFNL